MQTRKRIEFNIKFRFRHSQKQDEKPRPLLIRLTMDGRTISDYMSGVTVRPLKWNQTLQMVMGRNQSVAETNERLAEVELKHREILRELKRRHNKGEGPRPTPELVKAEFLRPGSTSPRLHQWFGTYLNFLDSLHGTEDGRAEKTIARAYKAWEYVKQFDPTSPYLVDITTGWGKHFHAWLQIHPETGKKRMQKDSANKYLSLVRDAINYAIDEGLLANNVLDKFRPKRGKGKPVYFLEEAQIDQLMNLRSMDQQLSYVIWWSRLMCLTGMDYKDAIRYARNRKHFEKKTVAGVKIVIGRAKTNAGSCEIPLLPQVESLFTLYPEGPHNPGLPDLNRHLKKVIAPLIGFEGNNPDGTPRKLTSKILRKTAGFIFLRIGYTLEGVSRFLGHSSVRVTQEHYVSITSSYVDSEMVRVARMQVRLQPDVAQLPVIYKAS